MTFRKVSAAAFAVFLIALPAAGLAAGMATPANQSSVTAGNLEISGAFARATLPNAPAGGGYLSITNTGETPDRLVSASSPVAGAVSLHEMSMQGDVMKMRDLPDGIDIPAGATVKLAPNGLHMMFEHLKGAFVEGKSVPVTLGFEKAGNVTVQLDILGFAAKGPADSMGGMKM